MTGPPPGRGEDAETPPVIVRVQSHEDDEEDDDGDGPPVVAREGLPPEIEQLIPAASRRPFSPEQANSPSNANVGWEGEARERGGNVECGARPPSPLPHRAPRLHPGRRVSIVYSAPTNCLQEKEGEYAVLAVLPPEREEADSTPWLRASDLWRYLQSLFCPPSLSGAVRQALWRPVAEFLWFLSLIAWQVLFGLVVSVVAIYVAPRIDVAEKREGQGLFDIHSEYKDTHRLFGAILGFIIAFRTNNAYTVYYEGRRIVGNLINAAREIVLETYTALPKGTPGPTFSDGSVVPGGASKVNEDSLAEEELYLKMAAREVRRLVMLTIAFIRQDVRESRFGFLPGCGMEGRKFTQANWHLDPCRPRMWDLLSDEELTTYYPLPTRARPGVCAGALKQQTELISLRSEKGLSAYYRVVTIHVQQLLNCHEAMLRIRDTPMPFPVVYVLYFSCFVFVYSTPFLYSTNTVGLFLCVQLLVVIYYGLLKIADAIENPFRYASGGFSLPLEQFGRLIHADCLAYAQVYGGDEKSFIPAYLEQPQKKRAARPHHRKATPAAAPRLQGRRRGSMIAMAPVNV